MPDEPPSVSCPFCGEPIVDGPDAIHGCDLEPPPDVEGLAQLPHLTERELQVLIRAVEDRRIWPLSVTDEERRVLGSLHTAISEAIYAAQLDARRRSSPSDCRAKRWNGTPVYDGPHAPHFFTYGPMGVYTGSCVGR